jgi:hypothetical protein
MAGIFHSEARYTADSPSSMKWGPPFPLAFSYADPDRRQAQKVE